jgi:hypothetical protein
MRASFGLERFPPGFGFELVAPGNPLETQLSLEFASEKAQLSAY